MEQDKQPILSICIPTYNRAHILDKTIRSIVNQKIFQETNEIEIVISDNCSDDNTSEIAQQFLILYPEKIIYNRNPNNIKDANFEKVLSLGRGGFLKLNNDTLVHVDESLNTLLDCIRDHQEEKDMLFFTNNNLKHKDKIRCNNADEFIRNVSFWITWIGAYGFWKEDFLKLKNYNKYSHLQLAQVEVIFRVIAHSQKKIYIYNQLLTKTEILSQKGDYDIITVFIENYSFILNEQISKNRIKSESVRSEMKNILLNFITPWLVSIKNNPDIYKFECQNARKRIVDFYSTYPGTISQFYFKYLRLFIVEKAKRLLLKLQ